MRIALGLEYDGFGFCGWQSQAGGGSVQDALEAALSIVADAPTRVVCAGRTDAGVHALEQVVHFDVEAVRPLTAWVRGVNANLPPAVAVRWAHEVSDEFHARFSASGRRYRYLLLNRPQRPGLLAHRVGWHYRPLDLDLMKQAAAHLLGEHDFTSFRSAECQAKSPIKEVRRLDIARRGDLLIVDVEAGAFLHHMVRNIVGALVHIGKGAQPSTWMAEVLAARDRSLAAPTFPADGLYFAGVEYDPGFGLPKVGAGDTAILF